MNKYMKEALIEANKASNIDEVPVGAVIVCNNKIIGRGHNESNINGVHNHAEINAINESINFIKDWRLTNCDLYVTLEPCPMCAGAILKSRVRKVYIGAKSNIKSNIKIINSIFSNKEYYHKVDVEYLSDEQCSKIISDFFKKKRL